MMSFEQALHAVKNGANIQRHGWNGKGMWVFYVPPETAQVPQKFGGCYPVQAFLMMKTADDTIVPWLISQSDVLANDWTAVMPVGRLNLNPSLDRVRGEQ